MNPALSALHIGHMTPLEQALVVVLGVGPFLMLGVVIAVIRNLDTDDEPTSNPQVGA
ncbi:MAG: hypothetical protein NTX33_05375 [Propionibacteriales bacterium]|nr:hypothetical protein [Propionibacteriales bacterium]